MSIAVQILLLISSKAAGVNPSTFLSSPDQSLIRVSESALLKNVAFACTHKAASLYGEFSGVV